MTLKGTIFTDSYDSRLGTHASQQKNYDPKTGKNYAKTNGDAGSNHDVLAGGSLTMYGKCSPGPEGVMYTEGTALYISGGTAPLPQEIELETQTYKPPVPSKGVLDMPAVLKELKLTAGTYRYDSASLEAKAIITVSGEVDLYIDKDIYMAGQAVIVMEPGAKLNVYHGTGNVVIAGQGLVNKDQAPANFMFKSSTTGDIWLQGTSDFYGAIYAPASTCHPMGTSNTYGAVVGSRMFVEGTADFHYDEALGLIPGEKIQYKIKAWEQVR
jgi:hypothetical protein